MNYLGITYDVKNLPKLEPEFIPFGPWMDAFLQDATQEVKVAVERNEGKISVWKNNSFPENRFATDEACRECSVDG